MPIGQLLVTWTSRLFHVTDTERPWYSVIAWWELRRIPYNLIVGGAGTVAVMLVWLFVFLPPKDTRPETGVELLSVIIFGFTANAAYTLGWLVELTARTVSPARARGLGPRLLRLGIKLSLALVALPACAYLLMWILRIVGVRFT